ncbi:MAG: hypothetical protein FJ041_05800 [Candidatus Cloacimonetes bacterium]|nr:hypothetical protein [Candidatus Cloacimonadota bacterium]
MIHQHILKYVSSYINDTLNQIQDDVSIIYNYLEESNTHLKNPEVKLLEGADKAIELSIEFVGEKVYPAYKFMSESQVNSFGLAIFLAAVKYFNPQFKFVILDDVISSFDAQKRVRIPQLLSLELFQDFQFLIMTHDNILFDYIQRAFPTWQRYKFTNWDYITGPIYRLSSNYVEEIQRFIDDDEAINAGHSLGRYLEWVLGEINENIKCPIPYKIMNVYTLQELFDPFKSRLNKIIKKDKYVHILTKLLTDLDNVIFRNYCDHWKNEAAPINTEDVSSIFSKWLEIQSILFCNNCKSFVRLDITDSHIKCNCNQLDLKNDSYYETSDK